MSLPRRAWAEAGAALVASINAASADKINF